MDDLEVHELLIKDDSGEEKYRLINGNEVLVTGSITKVANFIGNNELFDISVNGNSGKYLRHGWSYTTERELSTCLTDAKLCSGFKEPVY